MKDLQDVSRELMSHVVFALNHSMDLKMDGIEPMTPFAIVVKNGAMQIKVFGGDTLEFADSMYEKTIKEEAPDFVVYASDAFITTDGVKYDAVLFKAYDNEDSEIYLFGQKYSPGNEMSSFKRIGNPGLLGTEINFNYDSNKKRKPGRPTGKQWWKFW